MENFRETYFMNIDIKFLKSINSTIHLYKKSNIPNTNGFFFKDANYFKLKISW